MKQPIRITVDPRCSLAYIEYGEPSRQDGYLDVVREPDGRVEEYGRDDEFDHHRPSVMVRFNTEDDIIAFEIICIDDAESVAVARDYARDNGLAFPDDIRAAAARNPAA